MEPIGAVLLDAAGTLLRPRAPIADTYGRVARAHGAEVGDDEISGRLRAAMRRHHDRRGEPSWRSYWGEVVRETTGCDAPAILDELYELYAHASAWQVAEGAEAFAVAMAAAGIKTAVVSNWDLRLRPLLAELGVMAWVDLIVVSAEEGVEKPDPEIFVRTCTRLRVAPAHAIVVGDSYDDDVEGARRAGLRALHFGEDVEDFAALSQRLATASPPACTKSS